MSRRQKLDTLRTAAPVVLPSLLLCDFGNLERETARLHEAGVTALHLDVMDGSFVPNFTYGMTIVEAFRKLTSLPLDVHLMMHHPERYLKQFYEAGADLITIHAEAVEDPVPVLEEIRRLGAGAGLAINPQTPVSVIEPVLKSCDLVLIMSVNAGFGGQSFNPIALDKLRAVRELGSPDLLLEVDGGIAEATIGPCSAAGAQLFVVGSAIFRTPDYGAAVKRLTESARSSREST